MSFSQQIGAKCEQGDAFTKELYQELVRRLAEIREHPVQIPPADWRAWIIPVVSCVAIAAVFFGYVYPQF